MWIGKRASELGDVLGGWEDVKIWAEVFWSDGRHQGEQGGVLGVWVALLD